MWRTPEFTVLQTVGLDAAVVSSFMIILLAAQFFVASQFLQDVVLFILHVFYSCDWYHHAYELLRASDTISHKVDTYFVLAQWEANRRSR